MAPARPRVVQIVNSLAPAGAERVAVDLACGLDPERFDTRLIVVRDGALRARVEDAEIPLTIVGGGFDLRAPHTVKRIHRELTSIRPDIVHTHMIGGDVVGRTAAWLGRVPIIVSTQHDVYRRPGVLDAFRRVSAGRVSAVVACSAGVVPYCVADLHMPEDKIELIENGIDVAAMRSKRVPGGEFVFGAVGTLIPVKGHDTLIRAFARLAEYEPQARLALAGDGRLRGPLEALASELGVADRVRFLGRVDDITEFFGGVDAIVHPSRAEGLPLAVLEAMAAPRPIVATDLPALREALAQGEAGIIVPVDDPGAMTAAMQRVMRGGADIERMVRTAFERVEERYSARRMIDEYARLYERLLADAGE